MTCPLLKEARVKYCGAAAPRKLIPLAATAGSDEICASATHTACRVYRSQPATHLATQAGSCPHLRESFMQYCSAAPVTRFIPYSESLLSRCGNDGFRYCELYLALAHPGEPGEEVDGIPLPGGLRYSANHMWLDVTEHGACHAGIDAFLARALGKIDRLSYVWLSGHHRPTAVFTVAGTDLQIVFPNPFLLTRCNLYLRADPSPVTREPYTGGWLFEGVPGPQTTEFLLRGPQARDWMENEHRRINEFLQQIPSPTAEPLFADGGLFAPGIARQLDRDSLLRLFHEFISPFARSQGAS